MSTLKSICGRFQKIAVLSVLLAFTAITAFAQERSMPPQQALASDTPQLTASSSLSADRSTFGKFERKGKDIVSYTSLRNGIKFSIGDEIILNAANNPNGNYFNIFYSLLKTYTGNETNLEGKWADHTFKIVKIVDSDDDNALLYFKLSGGLIPSYGVINVNAALAKNEFAKK